jgi:hypothetical protein
MARAVFFGFFPNPAGPALPPSPAANVLKRADVFL